MTKDTSDLQPKHVESDSLISPEWRAWALERGVELSPEGLVLPNPDIENLDARIVSGLPEAAGRIAAARGQGKDIIYLPGSYDLVHVGHLSYVDQVVGHYLGKAAEHGRELRRDDLYLVMMADDDALIGRIKAGKYIGNGGDELFRRPVESGSDDHGRSPRLDALASFPVDLVGFIPSPAARDLPLPYDLDLAHCRELAATMASGSELEHYTQILDTYERLEELADHHQSFADAPWRIAAWQLYVTLQLTNPSQDNLDQVPEPFSGHNVTRVMSAHDRHYYGAVNMISRWSGVAVDVIDDKAVFSTTSLLQQYGPDTLLNHKVAALQGRNSPNSA